MLVVINRIWPEPGGEARLEEAFSRTPGMKDVPGCLGFEFWRATGRAGEAGRAEYLVVTRWASREAFEAWRQSAHFQHAHRHSGASAGARSELVIYEVLRQA
ncbi:antibiotic biosynthesis monooxygenase family protein [Thermaerobacter litoralis]